MTTPFEREILTHHWARSDPFPRPYGDLYLATVDRFVRMGLLISDERGVRPNLDALAPYMDALAAVPLPEQRWIVPTLGKCEVQK